MRGGKGGGREGGRREGEGEEKRRRGEEGEGEGEEERRRGRGGGGGQERSSDFHLNSFYDMIIQAACKLEASSMTSMGGQPPAEQAVSLSSSTASLIDTAAAGCRCGTGSEGSGAICYSSTNGNLHAHVSCEEGGEGMEEEKRGRRRRDGGGE
eukprot:765617-Hanusia_phi.AAC.3